ncbi:DNA cytosine methyltransferase [Desulfofundulus salinus]|uniref:DNA (cytosine-5-)-methyltransferase n=2 Tax=Desulfofundulus salinus TaxID=2419843 RepID=A0A494WYX0_9FIRM|nr:DNA cytosine methyltransferase [Desulfofundulus salinum]
MYKIERLARGEQPRVLDLFSGCGGLSLGFHSAGFQIIGNVEIDPLAARTYARNFHASGGKEQQELHARPRDITCLEPEDCLRELYPNEEPALLVDVIVGGPPCQAFARIGRAKLREVAGHPHAFKMDPRATLYLRFLHYVRILQPVAILMENVPDILNYAGRNIPQEICNILEKLGYVCSYTLLNAVHYGVPQMRERMFLIGLARELDVEPEFPSATHWIDLPAGYEMTRRALKQVARGNNYVEPPAGNFCLKNAVTVREAIGDLPVITAHLEGKLGLGPKPLTVYMPYPDNVDVSEYARLMRNWPGFESSGGIYDHVIRYLPRDYPIFKRMKPGEEYPEAYCRALEIFKEKLEQLRRAGEVIEEGSERYRWLMATTVPPYDPEKFPNKWRKLEPDMPARTLTAHISKDTYSHIHYDSMQARTISVREAARLQSFPDGFRFEGTMNPAFRQIGNAVPPLLAKAIAGTILACLQKSGCRTEYTAASHGAHAGGTQRAGTAAF